MNQNKCIAKKEDEEELWSENTKGLNYLKRLPNNSGFSPKNGDILLKIECTYTRLTKISSFFSAILQSAAKMGKSREKKKKRKTGKINK